MTIAAALFFDSAVFPQLSTTNGAPISVQSKWVGLGILNPDGHAFFVLAMVVLVICVFGVLLIRQGTTGRYLAAMRGSETAAAGLGINLTWQRVLIFALSGVVAGIGCTLLTIQQQSVSAEELQLPALAGLRGHRGLHRGEHGGRGDQRRLRFRGHPAAAHLSAGPFRRQQPGLRPLRLRRLHLRGPSRGDPRVLRSAGGPCACRT
jgi:hypothetical protein